MYRSGIFSAILTGLTWSIIWQIIFTIFIILVWGHSVNLDLTKCIIAGTILSLLVVFTPIKLRKRYFLFIISSCYTVLITFLSLNLPFLYSENFSVFTSFVITIFLGIIVGYSIQKTLGNLDWKINSRYLYEKFFLRLLWGIGIVFFVSIVVTPFYIMLMTSFKKSQDLLLNPLDFSINVSQPLKELFSSYIELFTDYNFLLFLTNSLIVSIATVIITLIFSIPGAYAVSRLRFKGKEVLSRSILLIYLIPAIILVVPLYAVFSQLGLRNSLFGLCIVYPATTIPVALYMLKGYFSGLPRELDDAGLMDGLSRIQIIIKITLPLSVPALISVSLYVFMIAWNEFLFSFMFLDDLNLFTLSRGIVSLNDSEVPRQHLMAGSVVATIPVIILFLILEKFLVSGLTSGSVKG